MNRVITTSNNFHNHSRRMCVRRAYVGSVRDRYGVRNADAFEHAHSRAIDSHRRSVRRVCRARRWRILGCHRDRNVRGNQTRAERVY